MKIGFYLLGQKGYVSLRDFVDRFGARAVAFVSIGGDPNVENDYHQTIERLCLDHGVPHAGRREAAEGAVEPDLSFAIGWRWMIQDTQSLVVLHDSLLPSYRGFAPLPNMLVNGEPELGVTALRAAEEYDRGPIVGQKRIPITYPIRIQEAIEAVSPLYSALVLEIVERLERGEALPEEEQDEAKASYSLWRDEEDYEIDWSESAAQVRRLVDAVGSPYSGASTFLAGRKIRVWSVRPAADVEVVSRAKHVGKVIFMTDGKPVVVCGSGLLMLDQATFQDSGESIIGSIPFRSRFHRGSHDRGKR